MKPEKGVMGPLPSQSEWREYQEPRPVTGLRSGDGLVGRSLSPVGPVLTPGR